MIGTRLRPVTTTDDEIYVHPMVLAPDEVDRYLRLEAIMHEEGGWDVERLETATGELRGVICTRNRKRRMISVREFNPMDDEL
jgi:hypothetical protein